MPVNFQPVVRNENFRHVLGPFNQQSKFFRKVTSHNSFKEYLSRLILTDDNAFTKAAAAGKADRLPAAVLNGVKSDLKKLEAVANISPKDIYESVENTKSNSCQF